jgi:hypothetical protein
MKKLILSDQAIGILLDRGRRSFFGISEIKGAKLRAKLKDTHRNSRKRKLKDTHRNSRKALMILMGACMIT